MIPRQIRSVLSELTYTALKESYQSGKRVFLSGGAIGFDTLAALCVLKLRQHFPDVKLVLSVPCRSQSVRWASADRQVYETLLDKADLVIYVSDNYFEGCMQKRNRFLVDHASSCLCFLQNCHGGTWYTVSYAYDQQRSIRNLARELSLPGDRS